MRTLQSIELAWAGGFFAGEGCFHYQLQETRKRRGRNISAQLTQRWDTELVERFHESIGFVGKIYHASRNDHVWRVDGFERVQYTAAVLWPWLGEYKQEQYITEMMKWRSYR